MRHDLQTHGRPGGECRSDHLRFDTSRASWISGALSSGSEMKILYVLLWVLGAIAVCNAATTDLAPDVLARNVSDEVLTIIRADKELQAGNSHKVMQLVESKVLPHFDFVRMTQLAVGRNWRQATPEQQKALVDEFRTLLVRTYATALTLYRNQTIEYRPVRMNTGETDVIVKSVIRQSSGQSVAIDYGMEKSAGTWKVYDVKIEGVSLIDTYRSTFNTEVQRNGIDGLIKALSSKNQALAAQAVK
jgi:phospholipid transport system substrate-binding protein